MERIVHSAVSISKPKPTEINVTKPTPNLVTEAIIIEKPRHIEVVVSKGSVGVNGRNGVSGANGRDGRDGDDGGVFMPIIQNGIIRWEYREEANESPSSTNLMANIDRISNPEIYDIVNGE